MTHIEHFLFFPVVVLIALILIVLSFKLLVRLFVLFLFLLAIWYGLFSLGFAPSPWQVMKDYRQAMPKQPQAFSLIIIRV